MNACPNKGSGQVLVLNPAMGCICDQPVGESVPSLDRIFGRKDVLASDTQKAEYLFAKLSVLSFFLMSALPSGLAASSDISILPTRNQPVRACRDRFLRRLHPSLRPVMINLKQNSHVALNIFLACRCEWHRHQRRRPGRRLR